MEAIAPTQPAWRTSARRHPFWLDRAGARLDDLVLLREVGSGGTATIYEARVRDELVVCKLLAQRHSQEPELVRRLVDEGRHLSELAGRVCPPLLGRGALPDGRPFLLMERLSGHSLGEQLRRFGPVAPGRVRRWMRAVLAALGDLHDRGLVHCDLKPDNVFLCHDGRIELIDLGAAERAGRPLESAVGTPPFMAPEQRPGSIVDARTDVFAAGWLAAELLVGGHPARPLPAGWREILARARAPDPAARFADARAFSAAL